MAWNPTPKQAIALSRREREILFGGSRGGGKSEAGLVWLLQDPDYIDSPNFKGLVIRKSFSDLSDWIARARKLLGDRAEIYTHPPEIRFPSGAIVYMGHWGDSSAVSMYLGREFSKILLEELTDIFALETDYLKLMGSLRSSDATLPCQVFATTNPGGRGHSWVKKRWVDVATNKTYYDGDTGHTRIYLPSKVDDNPYLKDADPGYCQYLDSLPDRLRKAWRDGSWELAEGAFFTDFGIHMLEVPQVISEHEVINGNRLYGSLDVGKCLSYGQWYVGPDNVIHRLFTYYAELTSIRDHAIAVKNLIETHRECWGHFPKKIWAGPDAWTKRGTDDLSWRSPIDEFIDAFPKTVEFEKANDNRVNGCLIMMDMFKLRDGRPQLYYVDKYNRKFEEAIPSAMKAPNNPDDYEKTSAWTDHIVDEARYGLVGIYSWLTGERKAKVLRAQAAALVPQQQQDWYNDL